MVQAGICRRGHRFALAAAAVGWTLALYPMDAAGEPTVQEILNRILTANANAPPVASSDVVFKLRIKKPLDAPPSCVFEGKMQLLNNRQALKVGRRSAGLICWAVNQYVIGRLFEASEPMESFLSRFNFRILGEKLAGVRHSFLIQGVAWDPKNNPRTMLGWVDYERGLIDDGTIEFTWGSIETRQRYAQVNRRWVLTYQFLYTPRYDATLEIFYSNFRFSQ